MNIFIVVVIICMMMTDRKDKYGRHGPIYLIIFYLDLVFITSKFKRKKYAMPMFHFTKAIDALIILYFFSWKLLKIKN